MRPRRTTISCCAFVEEAQVDWCGFFSFSSEEGTYAADLDGQVDPSARRRAARRAARAAGRITAARDELIGAKVEVLVDEPGVARTHREAPEIDGIVVVPESLAVGAFHELRVHGAEGPDLQPRRVDGAAK